MACSHGLLLAARKKQDRHQTLCDKGARLVKLGSDTNTHSWITYYLHITQLSQFSEICHYRELWAKVVAQDQQNTGQ